MYTLLVMVRRDIQNTLFIINLRYNMRTIDSDAISKVYDSRAQTRYYVLLAPQYLFEMKSRSFFPQIIIIYSITLFSMEEKSY